MPISVCVLIMLISGNTAGIPHTVTDDQAPIATQLYENESSEGVVNLTLVTDQITRDTEISSEALEQVRDSTPALLDNSTVTSVEPIITLGASLLYADDCSELCEVTGACREDPHNHGSYCKRSQSPPVCFGFYWTNESKSNICYEPNGGSTLCPSSYPIGCDEAFTTPTTTTTISSAVSVVTTPEPRGPRVCTKACMNTPGCMSNPHSHSTYCKTWQNPPVCFGLYWTSPSHTETCFQPYSPERKCPERWPIRCDDTQILYSTTALPTASAEISSTMSGFLVTQEPVSTDNHNTTRTTTSTTSSTLTSTHSVNTTNYNTLDVIQDLEKTTVKPTTVHEGVITVDSPRSTETMETSSSTTSTTQTTMSTTTSSTTTTTTTATTSSTTTASTTTTTTSSSPTTTTTSIASTTTPEPEISVSSSHERVATIRPIWNEESTTTQRPRSHRHGHSRSDRIAVLIGTTTTTVAPETAGVNTPSTKKAVSCQALCDTLSNCRGGFGSTCMLNHKNKPACYGLFFSDASRSQMCYAPKDKDCPNKFPVPCP